MIEKSKIRAEPQEDGTYKVFVANRWVAEGLTHAAAMSKVREIERRGYNWTAHDRVNSKAATRRLRQQQHNEELRLKRAGTPVIRSGKGFTITAIAEDEVSE